MKKLTKKLAKAKKELDKAIERKTKANKAWGKAQAKYNTTKAEADKAEAKKERKKTKQIVKNPPQREEMKMHLVCRTLNLSIGSIVEFLEQKGHNIVNHSQTKLNREQLELLNDKYDCPKLLE